MLDRCYSQMLNSLQIDQFSDYYRKYEALTDDESGVITNPNKDRRTRLNCIVEAVKRRKGKGLENFKTALEQSANLSDGCKMHSDILHNINTSDQPNNEVLSLSRSMNNLSLSDRDDFIVRNFQCICCAGCNTKISNTSCLFDKDGDGSYKQEHVNPHGYHHEFITVTGITCRPSQLRWDSNETLEHTWFPGYKWTIIHCSKPRCSRHLGWRFQSVRAGADPQIFFGLCRPAILLC